MVEAEVVEVAVAADLEVEALAQAAASPKMSTVAVEVMAEVVLAPAVAVVVAAVELIVHAATQETASNAAEWEILAHVTVLQAVMDLDT